MPSPVPPEIKRKAIAEMLAGETAAATARKYGLDKSTTMHWRREAAPELPTGRAREENARAAMGWLIYDTLVDIFVAVRAQLSVATDEEWLKKQTAGELAELVGGELDRAIRLLAGFRPTESGTDEPDPGSESRSLPPGPG